MVVSGDKDELKIYHSYSGYPGGMKKTPFWRMLEQNPDKVKPFDAFPAIHYLAGYSSGRLWNAAQ